MPKTKATPWTPERLRELRQRLGLTQEQAAQRLGVARITWARWECGMHPVGKFVERCITLTFDEDTNGVSANA